MPPLYIALFGQNNSPWKCPFPRAMNLWGLPSDQMNHAGAPRSKVMDLEMTGLFWIFQVVYCLRNPFKQKMFLRSDLKNMHLNESIVKTTSCRWLWRGVLWINEVNLDKSPKASYSLDKGMQQRSALDFSHCDLFTPKNSETRSLCFIRLTL